MEDYILFSICTPHRQSHKWDVNEEGLVDFFGDMITPREAFDRFMIEYAHLFCGVIRASISVRTDVQNGKYAYTWTEIERFL